MTTLKLPKGVEVPADEDEFELLIRVRKGKDPSEVEVVEVEGVPSDDEGAEKDEPPAPESGGSPNGNFVDSADSALGAMKQ